jgi:nucleoside phosphorylase
VKKVLIIAALPRELAPLVRGWKHKQFTSQNRTVTLWQSDHAVAACAGIGSISARIATDAAYKAANGPSGGVSLIISAGLAGALTPDLRVADIVQPALVTDGVDGLSIGTAHGFGTLITSGAIAAANDKRSFGRSGALAVDMEAFAVADVARVYGIPFIAIKSISDELDFKLPPLGRFISAEGQFRTGQFILWTLMRPWCWQTVIQLGRNSAAAVQSLSQALENTIRNHTQQP